MSCQGCPAWECEHVLLFFELSLQAAASGEAYIWDFVPYICFFFLKSEVLQHRYM